MKCIIPILLLASTLRLLAASGDLSAGMDPTGQTTITAAQLLQLVNNGKIVVPKGGVIRTNNLPDITTDTRLTNWLWLDSRTAPAALKSYYGNGTQNNETNWVVATVAPDSITATHLQAASVTAGKIAGNAIATSNLLDNAVTDTKITAGAIVNSKIANGAISNANIALSTITGDRLATLTITDTNIAANTITGGKLVNGTVNSNQIASAGISTINLNGASQPDMFLMTDNTTGATALYRNQIILKNYNSNNIAIPTANTATTNSHTLGGTPQLVVAHLTCNSGELGYNAGEEIPIEMVIAETSENPVISIAVTSTQWFLTPAGTSNWRIRDKQGVTYSNITKANWRLRIHLVLLTGTSG